MEKRKHRRANPGGPEAIPLARPNRAAPNPPERKTTAPMEITILTLFPDWFAGPLGDSVLGRAREEGRLSIRAVDPRGWAGGRHASVDDAPYGGGGGMVLRADVMARAADAELGLPGSPGRPHTIMMSPRGRRFDQTVALRYARLPRLAIVCGHYEAIDQRFIDTRVDEEVSLGDFVLTGGEIPAMAIVDAVARLLPGVLGNETSADRDSFMDGLLEGPHYTRPEVFEGIPVPEVLRSGNHGAVEAWREAQALAITRSRRPDLYRSLLVEPEVLRRLARRARPFSLHRIERDGTLRRLFETEAVRRLPDSEEAIRRARNYQPGTEPGVRLVEVREARYGTEAEEQAAFDADVLRAVAEFDAGTAKWPSEAERFVRNLGREIARRKAADR